MNYKQALETVTKTELAKAQGKSQTHSTRDYPRFLKKCEQLESTFKELGFKMILQKTGNE